MAELREDRHMSDVEALMWNVDKDPFLSSTFGSVTVLDEPPDVDQLRWRMLGAAAEIPRLRQKVVPVLGRIAPPEWQEDADFDIDHHLRHLALPAPGSLRQLYDLATHVVSDPFDRRRPLWQFTIVDGVEGGRAALVQKMHHTITDGEGGIRMSEQFIDLTRDAGADVGEPQLHIDAPPPDDLLSATAEAVRHTCRRAFGTAQRAASDAWGVATHPQRLPGEAVGVIETARAAVRQVAVTDHAQAPLWTDRTLRRRFETLDVPFDSAYRAAKDLGGSLNDLFVAAAAGAAGAYHRRQGTPVGDLRMAMPVSTRSDRSAAGGNAFVPARVLVPAGVEDPVERFRLVHEALGVTKRDRMLGMVDTLAGIVNILPTSVVVRVVRQQVETVDFTASNVRAAPFELFIAGARIEATYPLGPLGGTAWNLTMMSYCGTLNLGLHVDAGAVDDPELLRECVREAFAELLAAAD